MTDSSITLRSRPQLRVVAKHKKPLTHPNSVRTCRLSPEDMMIQIRMESRYVTAVLTFEQAAELASNIIGTLPIIVIGSEEAVAIERALKKVREGIAAGAPCKWTS
jgi:hypothetical protein